MVFTNHGILFSHKNKWSPSACNIMSFENIMLNTITKAKKDKILYNSISTVGKFIETESRLEVIRGWREWGMRNADLMLNK